MFPERIHSRSTIEVVGRAKRLGQPLDISGYSVLLRLRKDGQQHEIAGAVVDGPNGLFHVVIPDDLGIEPGQWDYELLLYNSNNTYVVSSGTLDVQPRLP